VSPDGAAARPHLAHGRRVDLDCQTPRMTLPGSSLDTADRAARLIRGLLVAVGAVAAGTGTSVALRGTAAIPGGAPTVAGNDSVLRFYAVWWAAQGPAAWSPARDPGLDERRMRTLCVTTFLGGLARLAAVRTSGRPHPLFRALTVVELVAPPVLLTARRRLVLD
jgi:uncharacterized protein DUF4345